MNAYSKCDTCNQMRRAGCRTCETTTWVRVMLNLTDKEMESLAWFRRHHSVTEVGEVDMLDTDEKKDHISNILHALYQGVITREVSM